MTDTAGGGLVAGSSAGVFVGHCNNEWVRRTAADAQTAAVGGSAPSAYQGTGTAQSIAANRISHILGLTGPSLVVDTACSSSLVALHLASSTL